MDLELRGKVAVVTGGSRGIGKAIAESLANEGVEIALVARDASTTEATAAYIEAKTGSRAIAVCADTGCDASVADNPRMTIYNRHRFPPDIIS